MRIPLELDVSSLRSIAGPGVYFLVHDGEIVYVGQSACLIQRITSHLGSKDFDRVIYLNIEQRQLDAIEGALIRYFKPMLNRGCPIGTPWQDKEIVGELVPDLMSRLAEEPRDDGDVVLPGHDVEPSTQDAG